MRLARTLALLAVFLCTILTPAPSPADTKVLTAEATYTMGEGETMTFAEAMALQKAKQIALEQAGTYVESYTKIQNYQLTADEIQTIAGGVLQVDVLEKKRELVGDGLKFFVKIKATVTTDKVAELAERVKGKNVAEEYKRLQEEYVRLSKEVETWKQLVAKTPSGPGRETALQEIREREKVFAVIQQRETIFFERLVSGEALFHEAQTQIDQKRTCKAKKMAALENLYHKVIDSGFLITVSDPFVITRPKESEDVDLAVTMDIKASRATRGLISETNNLLCDGLSFREFDELSSRLNNLAVVLEAGLRNGNFYTCHLSRLNLNIVSIDERDDNQLALDERQLNFTATLKVPLNTLKDITTVRAKISDSEVGRPCFIHEIK